MAMVEAAAQKGPAGDALGTVEVAEKTRGKPRGGPISDSLPSHMP